MTIYVLQLENNKYYVGYTQFPEARILQHIETKGAGWTKLYPVKKILQIECDLDQGHEDRITIEMMKKYGIDNVRGGSFCQIKLDDNTKSHLNRMVRGLSGACFKCGGDHFMSKCPNKLGYTEIRCYASSINEKPQASTPYGRNTHTVKEGYASRSVKRKPLGCSRCGRDNHTVEECYASKGVKRKLLGCARCGRDTHTEEECYASSSVNNKPLGCARCGRDTHTEEECYASSSVKRKPLGCSRCGRDTHTVEECYASRSVNKKPLGCTRCGRDTHTVEGCYASSSVKREPLWH